jgi:hypothetical protein
MEPRIPRASFVGRAAELEQAVQDALVHWRDDAYSVTDQVIAPHDGNGTTRLSSVFTVGTATGVLDPGSGNGLGGGNQLGGPQRRAPRPSSIACSCSDRG